MHWILREAGDTALRQVREACCPPTVSVCPPAARRPAQRAVDGLLDPGRRTDYGTILKSKESMAICPRPAGLAELSRSSLRRMLNAIFAWLSLPGTVALLPLS